MTLEHDHCTDRSRDCCSRTAALRWLQCQPKKGENRPNNVARQVTSINPCCVQLIRHPLQAPSEGSPNAHSSRMAEYSLPFVTRRGTDLLQHKTVMLGSPAHLGRWLRTPRGLVLRTPLSAAAYAYNKQRIKKAPRHGQRLKKNTRVHH